MQSAFVCTSLGLRRCACGCFFCEVYMMKRLTGYFSRTELILWVTSVLMILISFFVFDRESYLTLGASLIGVTSLILNAKGNPLGQVLMIIFSIFYSIISFTFSYYGEMITYLGMTLPMAVIALVSWLRNPYKGNRAEVTVNRIHRREWGLMVVLTIVVTAVFYFILQKLGTSSLVASTVSITTSFVAAYLTFRRSPYFALAYASNDVVLLVLWVVATLEDLTYISVVVCFVFFLINDLYGFFNWQKMAKRQGA